MYNHWSCFFTPELGAGVEGIRKVKDLIRNTVADSSNKDSWLRDNPAELYFLQYDDACKINVDGEIFQTLIRVGKEVTSDELKMIGMPPCDARHLINQSNIPTVVYGPGNRTGHILDENIDIEDFITATKVLALTIYRWCE